MSCIYKFNGKVFNSELELDSYLIDREYLIEDLGDAVFSMTLETSKTERRLKTIERAAELMKEAYKTAKREFDEDGKCFNFRDTAYLGVNKFLNKINSQIEVEGGHLLYPIFHPDLYWENSKDRWLQGNWTDDEKSFLSEIDDSFDPNNNISESETITYTDSAGHTKTEPKYKYYRSKIEEKWKNQCYTGDITHKVLELLFTKTGDTYFKDTLWNSSNPDDLIETLKQAIIRDFQSEDLDSAKLRWRDPQFQHLLTATLDGPQLQSILNKAKELNDVLIQKYGENAQFHPEFQISCKVSTEHTGVENLLGIIDLLVVDELGGVHIVDYKTSVHSFLDFSSSKLMNYKYLIATYGRMLGKYGFNIRKSDYFVLPIQLNDFKPEGDKYNYSGISFKGSGLDMFQDISNTKSSNITNNLRKYIDYPYTIDISAEDLLKNVVEQEAEWFPKYGKHTSYTVEELKEELGEKGLTPNEEGYLVWHPKSTISKTEIKVKADEPGAEANFLQQIIAYYDHLLEVRANIVESVIKGFKAVRIAGEQGKGWDISYAKFPNERYDALGATQDWFKINMAKYCTPNWKIAESGLWDILKEFGIITLFNETSHQYDFVKISSLNLTRGHYKNANSTTLGANFKSDIYFQSNPSSMMMESTYGNIELMEVMLCLNNMKLDEDNVCVGNITVADPYSGVGIQAASNYELLTCFNEMHKLSNLKIGLNLATEQGIKFADKAQIAYTTLNDLEHLAEAEHYRGDLAMYKEEKISSAKSQLDTAIDGTVELKIKAFENIMAYLSKEEGGNKKNELKTLTTNPEDLNKHYRRLYNECLLAIAELKNIHFRQLLRDHSKWMEKIGKSNLALSGNWIDNPGNLQSETLNLLTKLVTEAYLNVRVEIQKPANHMRKLVELLKKEKGFNTLKEYTIGNLADLYKDLYEEYNGDIYFKLPTDPSIETQAGKEILEYVLPIINKNRYGENYPQQQLDINNPHSKYYRIPLCIGDSSALSSKEGLLAALKDRLAQWNPKTAWDRARATAEGIFGDENERLVKSRTGEELFKMNNIFSQTDSNPLIRQTFLKKYPVETNLETLFLKHDFAYISLEKIDDVFPMIKAACIHLTMQGQMLNLQGGFANDLEYAESYIKNKIKNESIIDENLRPINALGSKVRLAASKLVLGFSPVLFCYQMIQGIWNNISLIIRKPDGTDAFTLKHMLKAMKIVYKDLTRLSSEPSIIELLNRLYGINDMDMNTYIDRIKSDKHGIHNFTQFMFKFASRPDYYNRMTIFVAKMLADGSFDAYTLDEDGNLKYDWTKDERYRAFAIGGSGDEYELAKANYLANARLFETEHTKNLSDYAEQSGEEYFKTNLNDPMPLPRAYTNLEAESMKSLGDTIYGYYSHEKKSMIHSELWGAMFMLFRTFWSGKKNQYLGTKGVKLEGNWEPYTETDEEGNKIYYYYPKDADGNILYNEPPVLKDDPTASDAMVIRWKGNWKEGILSTVFDLLQTGYKTGPQGIRDKWYAMDENIRKTQRANLIQLSYDLTMFVLVGNLLAAGLGGLYDDEKKESDKRSFEDALKLTALNIAIKSLNNSFLDFNFIKSIGEPGVDWTPFSLSYLTTLVGNVFDTCMGEKNIFDTIARSNAIFTLARPIFTTLKYNFKD